MELLARVEAIVIHHSEREYDFPEYIRMRQARRGFEDVGYHYMIGNGRLTVDGHLYSGRLEQYQGAHVESHNDYTLGICLIGNHDHCHPSPKQLNTLHRFLLEKMEQYDVALENILGHREFEGVEKSCPGKNVDLDAIRARLLRDML